MLDELRAQTDAMVDALRTIVSTESPSASVEATDACAGAIAAVSREVLGREPERLDEGGRPHLFWPARGRARILLLGHFDTVWPLGTLARWPFAVDGERATGPGCFDMKAGIVQGLFAMRSAGDPDDVALLFTSDEETGAATSRDLIERTAKGLDAVLVLEPAAGGAPKTARKGVGGFAVRVAGRAAHAGLNPEDGVNAMVELAHQVVTIATLGDPARGTTVVPTVAAAGTTENTVPAAAHVEVNVRAWSAEEMDRVERDLRALTPRLAGSTLSVETRHVRGPLEDTASADLFARAHRVAAGLGIDLPAEGARVGGASDGNFTAAMGVPTLDGLGPVGDGAHAEGEHVLVSAMPERAALVAALLEDLLAT